MAHILLTNDDGIHAPGLKHLSQALSTLGELSIVAPTKDQSGVGLGITLHTPLHIEKTTHEYATDAWKITGTPTDCVKMALTVLLPTPPDIIVSGINRGSNHGRSIFYSGTVGGVVEAAFRGIPGIAFSCTDYDKPQYEIFTDYVKEIVQYALQHPAPKGTLLNVNFPLTDNPKERYLIKLTRQGRQYWKEKPEAMAPNQYILGGTPSDCSEHHESDTKWLEQGYITVSPIQVNELTDHHYLEHQKEHFENFFR